jgi:uncharacterized protein (DUF924 family)
MNYQDVLNFWFEELEPKQWWVKDDAFDQLIKTRFGQVLQEAALGECWQWRNCASGRLAEVIVLDQFSRNIYRNKPQSFAQDALALVLAQEAVRAGADQVLSIQEKCFLYMPYMHSESLVIHDQAVLLFDQPGLENNYGFELKHKVIIERFGRYPHRNAILGRKSTPEEKEFLLQPGSGF